MPCDSIIVNRVDMPKMNPDLLARALKGMAVTNVRTIGQDVYFTHEGEDYVLRRGQLEGRDGQDSERVAEVANKLKVGYSHQVVKATAAKQGWQLKQTGPNSYVSVKR